MEDFYDDDDHSALAAIIFSPDPLVAAAFHNVAGVAAAQSCRHSSPSWHYFLTDIIQFLVGGCCIFQGVLLQTCQGLSFGG